jgi:hypothetical protein
MSASHHIIDVPIPPKDSALKEIAVAALFRIGGGSVGRRPPCPPGQAQ